MEVERLECCGIAEASGLLPEGEESFHGICEAVLGCTYLRGPLLIFSDIVARGRGKKLAAYIRRHKLGSLKESKAVLNRNSGNVIKVWIWQMDREAMLKRYKKIAGKYEEQW